MLKCCSLLGICLVVMLAIDFLNYFIVNKYAPDTTGTFVYFSQTDGGYGIYGVGMTFILGLLFAAKFVVPGLIFKIVTKIPNKVVFANSKGYEKMRGTAVVLCDHCSYNARDSISRNFFADFSSIWRHLRYYDHCCCERFMLL